MGDRRPGPTLANLATWMVGSFFLTAALIQGCIPEPSPPPHIHIEMESP